MFKKVLQPANLIILILSIFALGYSGYRAYVLSITHDEAYVFLNLMSRTYSDIVGLDPPHAGNHILNTLLMKFFSGIFGSSQLVLRFHSLLAHAGYLLFTYLILKRLTNNVLLVAGFILLNFNPYFLDFASLARGYSLAHTFTVASVYYLLKYDDNKQQKYWMIAMICACLTAYSQFVMLYFYTGVILLYNLLQIPDVISEKTMGQKFKLLINRNKNTFIIFGASIVMFFEPIRRLVKFNQIYGRGTISFWHDTVKTFVQGSLYNRGYFLSEINFFSWFLTLIVVLAILVLLINYVVKRKIVNNDLLILIGLLFSIIFISQVHCIFGNGQYLCIRTTLFYHPLIILTLIMLLHQFQSFLKGIPVSIVALTLAGFMLFHFGNSANTKFVTEWIYDCNTRQMLKDVSEDYNNNQGKGKIKIAIHWTFEPAINYYRVTQKYDWLEQANHDGFELQANYYYIYKEDSAYLYKTGRKILKRYEFSNTILAKDTMGVSK
jgi:hypothetical protein